MGKTDLHELRKDPLLGRWVAVLNQSKTPSEYVMFPEDNNEKDCFFCAGREKELPPEIMSIPNPDELFKKMVDKGDSQLIAGLPRGR